MKSTSNIRAFVQWKEPTIFSGEEIECVITFKNTAKVPDEHAEQEQTEDNSTTGLHSNRSNGPTRPRVQRKRTVTQSTGISRAQFSIDPSVAASRGQVLQGHEHVQAHGYNHIQSQSHDFFRDQGQGQAPEQERGHGRDQAKTHSRNASLSTGPNSRVPSYSKGHRPTLSLNVMHSPGSQTRSPQLPISPHTTGRPKPKHSRSLSILSMRSDAPSPALSYKQGQSQPPPASRRPVRAHGRSASVQIMSTSSGLPSPAIGFSASKHHSPSLQFTPTLTLPFSSSSAHASPLPDLTRETPPLSSFSPDTEFLTVRPTRRASANPYSPSSNNPTIAFPIPIQSVSPPTPSDKPKDAGRMPTPDFQFPPRDPAPSSTPASTSAPNPTRQLSHERLSATSATTNPISRLLSDSSINATPRSSGSEFYSFGNNSSDTLASEAPVHVNHRSMFSQTHSRQASRSNKPLPSSDDPELLMMGYAQTVGSFTLDGSLVNQAPFEDVKRKGVLGSQAGGGVVGVDNSKRQGRLFGGFGWGNLGESIGGLLGTGEMSSIKEMRGAANTNTIPLLSTPQSILFVDLGLAPGQSMSYNYRFQLPRGLPPTHKGRAIKVQYHIRLGIQRSGTSAAQQNVKHIDIPFRVLGSVNSRGESLGHDLMSPYILLTDRATTTNIPTPTDSSLVIANNPSLKPSTKNSKSTPAALDDFLEYADNLLGQSPSASKPFLSPTSEIPRRRSSTAGLAPANMKEAIDLAIARSNLHSSISAPSQSTNRFTIARAGTQVAILSLLRPAYRLGETVTGILNFAPPAPSTFSAIPVYALDISLETVECVDPSFALRSESSIQRATRKVYARASETVLFSRQTAFRLEIPTVATPTFETTGVLLSWRLRVEFVTAKAYPSAAGEHHNETRGLGIREGGEDGSSSEEDRALSQSGATPLANELLEEVGSDERGTVLIAKERLISESFEVAVPIRVYGVAGLGAESVFGNALAEPLEV